MGKLAGSLLISTVMLFLAYATGWISFSNGLPTLVNTPWWNQAVWFCIIAAVFSVVSYAANTLFEMFTIVTCFLGCLFLPLYFVGIGYVKLMAVSYLLPGFVHTNIWWQVLLLSTFVGFSIPPMFAVTYTVRSAKYMVRVPPGKVEQVSELLATVGKVGSVRGIRTQPYDGNNVEGWEINLEVPEDKEEEAVYTLMDLKYRRVIWSFQKDLDD